MPKYELCENAYSINPLKPLMSVGVCHSTDASSMAWQCLIIKGNRYIYEEADSIKKFLAQSKLRAHSNRKIFTL